MMDKQKGPALPEGDDQETRLLMDQGLSEEDADTIMLLRAGLEKLDVLVPVIDPDPRWLEANLVEHGKEIRRRFIRDLVLFLMMALLILTGLAAALLRLPMVFFALQGVAWLAAPAVLLANRRKRVRES
jgi:hypothetical protein